MSSLQEHTTTKEVDNNKKKDNHVQIPFPKLKLLKPEEYLKGKDANLEANRLRDINLKYAAMKNFLYKRKEKTEQKIKELNESILTVRGIEKQQKITRENGTQNKKTLELFMPLEETLYVKGEINLTDTIYLWLGANVLVELKFDEALTLLESHLSRAHDIYKQLVEETEYMRKQVEIASANLTSAILYLQKKKREEMKMEVKN